MEKRIVVLVVILFFGHNADSKLFSDYPLLEAPYKQAPYRAVGAIMKNRTPPFELQCTGTPIAPTVVLTAAHCLYDLDASGWEPQLYFFPATALGNSPPMEAKKYIVPRGFLSTDKDGKRAHVKGDSFDFGVIILDQSLDGHLASLFSVYYNQVSLATPNYPQFPPHPKDVINWVPESENLPNEASDLRVLAGYSQEQAAGSARLHVTFCPLAPFWIEDHFGVKTPFYGHQCSATEGMSGGPIFYRQGGDHYKILGVHLGDLLDIHYGLHIDHSKYSRIQYWVGKQEADPVDDIFTVF